MDCQMEILSTFRDVNIVALTGGEMLYLSQSITPTFQEFIHPCVTYIQKDPTNQPTNQPANPNHTLKI